MLSKNNKDIFKELELLKRKHKKDINIINTELANMKKKHSIDLYNQSIVNVNVEARLTAGGL
jgi:hypothetical protein